MIQQVSLLWIYNSVSIAIRIQSNTDTELEGGGVIAVINNLVADYRFTPCLGECGGGILLTNSGRGRADSSLSYE